MLAGGVELIARPYREGYAIGAFSTYNLEITQAICRAAEALLAPVIIQAGSSAFSYSGEEQLAYLCLAAARSCGSEVGIHLDHSRDLEEIGRCLDAGYTSVMIDGSGLPFTQNVSVTRRVVEMAHATGAWVEAELGQLVGDEDVSQDATASDMTDPDAAARFVEETSVDALAVAIGNVHGFTSRPVQLDYDRLEAIRDRTGVPLVLHGSSGLSSEQVRLAAALGVAKFNVNAELRRAFLESLQEAVQPVASGYDIAAAMKPAIAGVQAVVAEKIALFAGRTSAGGAQPIRR